MRTSRSVSVTRAVAEGTWGTAAGAAGADVPLFGAGAEPAGLAAAGAEDAASGVPVTGFGTGFTTNPCQR
jgi:hypothetical protein